MQDERCCNDVNCSTRDLSWSSLRPAPSANDLLNFLPLLFIIANLMSVSVSQHVHQNPASDFVWPRARACRAADTHNWRIMHGLRTCFLGAADSAYIPAANHARLYKREREVLTQHSRLFVVHEAWTSRSNQLRQH